MKLISDNALEEMLATIDAHHAANVQLEKMATTINTNPTVHAHWIKSNCYNVRGLIYECSNCNTVMFSAWNYCPNCGAKMDEEEE